MSSPMPSSAPVAVPGRSSGRRTSETSVAGSTPRSSRLRTISEHVVDDEPVELDELLAEHRSLVEAPTVGVAHGQLTCATSCSD